METTVSVNSLGMFLRSCYVFAADRLFLIGGNLFFIQQRELFFHNFFSINTVFCFMLLKGAETRLDYRNVIKTR
jgi:hypothetical protein